MYTKKKCKIYVLSVLLCTFFFSCSSIDFELPQGPQGTNGKSAYEIWKEENVDILRTQKSYEEREYSKIDLGYQFNELSARYEVVEKKQINNSVSLLLQ